MKNIALGQWHLTSLKKTGNLQKYIKEKYPTRLNNVIYHKSFQIKHRSHVIKSDENHILHSLCISFINARLFQNHISHKQIYFYFVGHNNVGSFKNNFVVKRKWTFIQLY